MAQVHPQDTVDVPLAARRNATYDCDIVLDAVQPFVTGAGPNSAGDADPGQGDVPPLGRLAAAVDALIAVKAQFRLFIDDYGRPRVEGKAQATVVLPCQRCLDGVTTDVAATLGQLIWFGDEPPKELASSGQDVMLSSTTEMSFAALIEDDLLLALPQKVCQIDDCERLPVLAYPAPGYSSAKGEGKIEQGQGAETEDQLPDDRQRPFAGLDEMMKNLTKMNTQEKDQE